MKKPFESKAKRLYSIFASVFFMLAVFVVPAFAADGDPLAVVNNLSDFIFSLIRAVGLILLGFGILQVGLSLKSHDPSQRANGILTVAGGIVITFTKEIQIYKRLEQLGQLDKLSMTRPDKGYEKVAYPRTINQRGKKA